MTTSTKPEIQPFSGTHIPEFLKSQKRWAPWKAVFNDKRGKFDKIPYNAQHAEYGISTAAPERWSSFPDALSAYQTSKGIFSGVGYVMTRPHGVVGVDLDNCIHDGVIAPWALAVIAALDSYTERSPSGRGLRVFGLGETSDWTNHQVGIEVYGGAHPRFLTITGDHVKNTPLVVRPLIPAALAQIRAQFATEVRKVEIEAADMPELLPECLTPDIEDLDLGHYARDFLDTGDVRGDDRSAELHATAISLYQAGLEDQEVFTVLSNNPHAMEVALDHRRQDTDRASLYIWKEHCQKAKPKAAARVLSADEFDDLGGDTGIPVTEAAPADPLVGFDDISTPEDKAAKVEKSKEPRFRVQSIPEFMRRPPATWLIKGVLPKASLAVVFGESGSGKTFFTLDLVASIARGLPWRDKKTQTGRVVYICAEGEAGFRTRTAAYLSHSGIDDMPLGVIGDAPNFMEKGDIRDLIVSVKAFGRTDVIVVDTFAQVMPAGNENSGEDVGRVLAHCKALHRTTGALVILVHHAGKNSSKGARGWSGLRAAADAEIEVVRTQQGRSATVTKLKDGEDGAEYGFTLATVVLGVDDDGDTTSSCVVAHGEVAAAKDAPKTPKQALIVDTFNDLLMGAPYVDMGILVANIIAKSPMENGKPPAVWNTKRDVKALNERFFTVSDDKVFPQTPQTSSSGL